MPTLTVSLTLTHGSTTPETAVPQREPFSFEVEYTEEATKTVRVPFDETDYPIALDSLDTPKFLFVQSLETDVTVKLATAGNSPIALVAGEGWIMLTNPDGQAINALLVTTPASPATGALVRILAVE